MTKVKICGLMEKEHIRAAVDAGVDAVGFVFAPSRRRVTVEQARELASEVPSHVLKIGVFVNATQKDLLHAFREVPLDYVQYHGEETDDFIQKISLPSIKVVSVRGDEEIKKTTCFKSDYVLFDTPGIDFRGGSGKTFDWSVIEDIPIKNRLILAGGLHTGNVLQAIRQVNPYMVDVSSGVEVNRRKDTNLIREFIKTVKEQER
ncbi:MULTISPECIES: phosphoribosylanthranilate isomerase [Sporosarcina]|uniref:N-(5'-phosphoribosyl)anthranilate isomerase n=1 Tax=Sporosarcina contaminans TaxID=633403 RepID=A0ABW3TX44_9BACL